MPAGDCRPVKPDEEKESPYGSKLSTRILNNKRFIFKNKAKKPRNYEMPFTTKIIENWNPDNFSMVKGLGDNLVKYLQ
jgi:hypothetical protein